jgi:hypothetical protein
MNLRRDWHLGILARARAFWMSGCESWVRYLVIAQFAGWLELDLFCTGLFFFLLLIGYRLEARLAFEHFSAGSSFLDVWM